MMKGMINMKKCNRFFYKLILAVTLFACIFICAGSLANAHDNVFANLFSSTMRFLLPVTLSVMICLFIAILFQIFDTFNRKQLIISAGIMFCIMALAFAVILYNFCSVPYSDARKIHDLAMYFAKTGKHPVEADAPHAIYFGRYSNNYFLTIIFSYLFKVFEKTGVSDIYAALQVLTASGIMIAAVFMYLIGVKAYGIRGGAKVLALCVLNPVYYILILWVYTNVISIPFMTAVIYFGICIYQEKRRGYLAGYCIMEAVCSVVGYFIRPTVVIPLIALVICGFLSGLADRSTMYKLLRCSLVCAIAGLLLFVSVSKLNDRYFSTVSEGNYPVTHWLMMGSHDDGMHNMKDVRYTKSFDTKNEKTKATLKKTIENYKNQRKTGLVSFFKEKLIFSWSLGDGDELIRKASQDKKQTKLYSWMLGDRQDLFRLYCYSFRIANILLVMAALLNLIKKKAIDAYQFLFVLSLFGGILFYCFWEVKGSYTAPFIYVMILAGVQGGDLFKDKVSEICMETLEDRMYWGVMMLTILPCAVCICIVSYYGMTETDVLRQDWSLCFMGGKSEDITADTEVSEISQEFYTSKPINRIVFGARTDKRMINQDTGCQVMLLEDGREVYSTEISGRDVRPDGSIVLEMKEIAPEDKTKFTLQFRKMDKSKGALRFQQKSNTYIDTYEGKLAVNGKERMNDMHLQVYKEYEAKWCSKKAAFIINGGGFTAVFLMFLWIWNGGNIRIERKGVKKYL